MCPYIRNWVCVSKFQWILGTVCIIIIIIIIIIHSLELFPSALADSFSQESEWQQVSSSFQDSSQYSGRPQQCCCLDSLCIIIIIIIIIIVVVFLLLWEFFTPMSADYFFLLEFEWQEFSSGVFSVF